MAILMLLFLTGIFALVHNLYKLVTVRRELDESLLFVKLQLDTGFHGSIYLTENGSGFGAKIKQIKVIRYLTLLPFCPLMHSCFAIYVTKHIIF